LHIKKKSLNDKNKTSLHYDNDEEVSSWKKKCGVKWESKINKGTQPLINSTCTAFLFVAIVDSGLVMNAVSSIYCDYPATKEKK